MNRDEQKKRLQQRKLRFEQILEKIDTKLDTLQEAVILETRVEEKLRLKDLIEEAEVYRKRFTEKLDVINEQLSFIDQYDLGKGEVKKARIFISYKRNVEPDEWVALRVFEALSPLHHVFIDQTMLVGTLWAKRIETELGRSDFLITFLSAQSVQSEMVLAEIELAHRLGNEHNGRPVILPVRLNYREPFQYPLSEYLNSINWADWQTPEDTAQLIEDLKRAIAGIALPYDKQYNSNLLTKRLSSLPPPPFAQLETPEGTIKSKSPFYVERPSDEIAHTVIKRQGETLTIKAPRQMGKSSLLMRVMETAKQANKQTVFLDFQLMDKSSLADADTFFRQFCAWLTIKLKLENRIDDFWKMPLSNNLRCTYYVEHLLEELDRPFVLAMDEVDNIFSADFRSDFFGMLRSWHNSRMEDPKWEQLDLALVTSTEPFLFIKNPNQSPFNVGETVRLQDFTLEQVDDLNRHHRFPLTRPQIERLMVLLNGHPYLVRRTLYLIANERVTAAELFSKAVQDDGPFGDHLRYYAFRLHGHDDLIQGFNQVLKNHKCEDDLIFYRLHGAGLVRREGNLELPRCQLYGDYFREHLDG